MDEPRPGGTGNYNDGNAARTAFKRSEEFAAAPGIDEQLIHRLHVVLQAVSCCLPLSNEALAAYCTETAELYVHLYAWSPMPTTLHRLLMHSAEVVQQCLLPVGMMSEEAAEARQKDARLFRLHRAHRESRHHTMADILGRLLITSDPIISSMGVAARCKAGARQHVPLLREARLLLAQPPPLTVVTQR